MTSQNGRAFNEWLRAQLKAKKMSQRHLAQQSGVDHSTISRLIRGDRMPSLGTATKLARGLREIREDADTAQYLGLVTSGSQNPTARVEYALRGDEALTEAQVRQIMEYYLAVRIRRFGRVFQAHDRPEPASNNSTAGRDGATNGTRGTGPASGGASGALSAAGGSAVSAAPARTPALPSSRPNSYGGQVTGLVPRVGVATRVAPTAILTRASGRGSDRY